LLAMISEATAILAEGIAQRPQDIDLVLVHGYGFPRWRGGLMHYADRSGWTPSLPLR
jgi:3-hydroxyacyl-CoA dehydrogenase